MDRTQICSLCHKATSNSHCIGCDSYFCVKCYISHRQTLNHDFANLINERDVIQDKLNKSLGLKTCSSSLEPVIDQWEKKMLIKVREIAERARKELDTAINRLENQISTRFTKLSQMLMEMRESENYMETDLERIRHQLKQFNNNLIDLKVNRETIIIEDTSDRVPWDTLLQISSKTDDPIKLSCIPSNATWSQYGKTVIDNLERPLGLAVDQHNGMVYVADQNNNQIVVWNQQTKKTFKISSAFSRPSDVLIDKMTNTIVIADYHANRVVRCSLGDGARKVKTLVKNIECFGLAMDKEGALYVSDYKKHEVRKFFGEDKTGIVVAGGNGEGDANNQLHHPRFITIDDQYTLYISDRSNHRVVKWMKGAKQGIVVAGGNGPGSRQNQLDKPNGIAVDAAGHVYVADAENERIVRWRKGEKTGEIIIGGNGRGTNMNQFDGPIGLCFDRQNNLLVSDIENGRVQYFSMQ